MSDYTIAYGVINETSSSKSLSSVHASANVASVESEGVGQAQVNYYRRGSDDFSGDPAVVASPMAPSEKQVRIELYKEDSDRQKFCIVETYDQDGDSNEGLENVNFGFIAISREPVVSGNSALQIVACLVDGTGNKELEIHYGTGSNALTSPSTGVYTVAFDNAFAKPPTVVATLARTDLDEEDESVYRSVVITNVTTQSVTVTVYDEDSRPNNEWFTLIAVGEAASGVGNASSYDLACGYIDRDGDINFNTNIDDVDKSGDATYKIDWDDNTFSRDAVVVACPEHSTEARTNHIRQAQVSKTQSTSGTYVQIASPKVGNYNDSRFHVIALAMKDS